MWIKADRLHPLIPYKADRWSVTSVRSISRFRSSTDQSGYPSSGVVRW